MRTLNEIRDRLLQMLHQRHVLTGRFQLAVLNAEIRRLMWVLNLAPDLIILPRHSLIV